ncbi:MAG: hypothetical protein RLZZ519_3264 [Bacteroidota bacterium]
MSFLKKIFPFLFKKEQNESSPKPASKPASSSKPAPNSKGPAASKTAAPSEGSEKPTFAITGYGIVARARNARGLRKGSKVYVRSILEDGDRLRVRGTAPNGNKVTITVPRRTLADYQSEGVPENVEKHYDKHSFFKEEHEAKMKAEALGKH